MRATLKIGIQSGEVISKNNMDSWVFKLQNNTIFILFAALSVSLITNAYLIVELNFGKRTLNCSDFNSQTEALPYLKTNPQLDLNHDGIPCNGLPK